MMRISNFMIVLLFIGCTLSNKVPDNIIKQEKMADILVDVSLAESFTEVFIMKDSSLIKDSVLKKEISKVLSLHNTSITQFSQSYSYYSKHPGLFKVLMDTASVRINKRRDMMYSSPLNPAPKNLQ